MISKGKHIVIFVGVLIGFSCCVSDRIIQQHALVDIHERPICFLSKDNKTIYYTESGKTIEVYLGGLEFKEGKDSLSTYLGKQYVNHSNYDYTEYNMLEHFFILFDKNLNVVEVRIMKRPHNEKFYYDSIFIEALKKTIGMWHKTVENKKWYIYLHRQRVY